MLLLAASQPTVVLVGEPVFRLSAALCLGSNQSDFSAQAPKVVKVEQIQRYIDAKKALERDNANCAMCLHLPSGAAEPGKLLGLACRASPALLLVEHVAAESGQKLLTDEQFFAFGFRVVEKTTKSGSQQALYAYSLSDYKQAPEWLNARFWAHPERFSVLE